MKVTLYGASVSAQKAPNGFAGHLNEVLKSKLGSDFELDVKAYGASHLSQAGYAMIGEVIACRPDIVLMDWCTPGTKSYKYNYPEIISGLLLERGILPVWLMLPRADDKFSQRESCKQVFALREYDIPVYVFSESCADIDSFLSNCLRDVVHTNKQGGPLYGQWVYDSIEYLLEEEELNKTLGVTSIPDSQDALEKGEVPAIFEVKESLEVGQALELVASSSCAVDIEIFLFCEIGPYSPCLHVKVFDDAGMRIASHDIRLVDQWCHYSRVALVPFRRIAVPGEGVYRIEVMCVEGNPFERFGVETKKPIDAEVKDEERSLVISKMSFSGVNPISISVKSD